MGESYREHGLTVMAPITPTMRSGIDSALLGLGLSSIDELTAADLGIPDGFWRDLGVRDQPVSRPCAP